MNWIESHSRVDEGVIVGSNRINHLIFADHLVLLESSEQGFQQTFDQFSAACDQTGMKIISWKTEELYVSR